MKRTGLMLLGFLTAGAAVNASAAPQDNRRPPFQSVQGYRPAEVDVMISRAYRELLRREPDQNGLAHYRYQLLWNGLTQEGMRQEILDSPEYRNRMHNVRGWQPNRRR